MESQTCLSFEIVDVGLIDEDFVLLVIELPTCLRMEFLPSCGGLEFNLALFAFD